jgi:antitoxin ChpS
MHTTNLRKVGGSVMLAVPPAILDLLHLEVGTTVGLAVDGDRLLVKPVQPQTKPKYTLDELLSQCDPNAEMTEEDRVWLNLAPVGKEL